MRYLYMLMKIFLLHKVFLLNKDIETSILVYYEI
jgi:hypothetical protein